MTTITLPWPPSTLSPNARQHYMALSRAKKAYRHACAWQAKSQGLRAVVAKALHVSIEFHAPDRRHRDTDNMLASIKAGLDGLADVLEVDDSKWTLAISRADTIGGFVRVTIEAA